MSSREVAGVLPGTSPDAAGSGEVTDMNKRAARHAAAAPVFWRPLLQPPPQPPQSPPQRLRCQNRGNRPRSLSCHNRGFRHRRLRCRRCA
eukprot:262347-Chlamydomonas_euryale.AAC.2